MMKRFLMSIAVMCVYATMAFAGQQEQSTQSADNKSAVASASDTNMNTDTNKNEPSSKAQQKDNKKKNNHKPKKDADERTQEEKDFDRVLLGIYGG